MTKYGSSFNDALIKVLTEIRDELKRSNELTNKTVEIAQQINDSALQQEFDNAVEKINNCEPVSNIIKSNISPSEIAREKVLKDMFDKFVVTVSCKEEFDNMVLEYFFGSKWRQYEDEINADTMSTFSIEYNRSTYVLFSGTEFLCKYWHEYVKDLNKNEWVYNIHIIELADKELLKNYIEEVKARKVVRESCRG